MLIADYVDDLKALAATHAAELQALLPPHLWPLAPFKVEQFGSLTKYTLGPACPAPDGRGDVWAMLHHLRGPDEGPPHDHPVAFEAHMLSGGYIERLWQHGPRGWHSEQIARLPGRSHIIAADCVHQIVALPDGDAWSLCFAGPIVREWRHYPELVAAGVQDAGRPDLAP